ncbi:hypothetical protein D1007_36061 [Hordeum vulgare]|nr:hypothetical protein D1007_36061 [Hordeum vulgare]
MHYYDPTFELPLNPSKRRYPTFIVVETMLHMWVISRWRGANELVEWFLGSRFAHLPTDSPVMFRLEEVCPNSSTPPTGLLFNFTNSYNIFTDFDNIFPTRDGMHVLPYYLCEDDMEEEQQKGGGKVKMVLKDRSHKACLDIGC